MTDHGFFVWHVYIKVAQRCRPLTELERVVEPEALAAWRKLTTVGDGVDEANLTLISIAVSLRRIADHLTKPPEKT